MNEKPILFNTEMVRAILECNFAELWDSINGNRGYGRGVNPWVWVVEFEKVIQ